MPNHNLLDLIRDNPHGWGNIPLARPQAEPVLDEWNQPHDGSTGAPMYGPDPTLMQNLQSLGEMPARTVSPYNLDTGEFQVPPMLSEPANALHRMGTSGGFPDPQDPQNQHDASTLLMTMMGGNAMNPATALPKNALGMFAGRRAKTADHQALARAEGMAASGAGRDAIWNDTGWFQGADDKWRFEIDDSNAGLSKWRGQGPLGKVLQHPEMSAAYPSVAGIGVKTSKGANALTPGDYTPAGEGFLGGWLHPGKIEYSKAWASLNDEGARPTLLHEAQHAIQQKEGFARGAGETEYSYTADGLNRDGPKPRMDHAQAAVSRMADAMMEKENAGTSRPDWQQGATQEDRLRLMDEGFEWDKKRDDYKKRAYTELNKNAYAKSAGEVEARNVVTRSNMSATERRATPPWATQDIPDEKQFLQQYGKLSPLPVTPVKHAGEPAWMKPVTVPEFLPPAPLAKTYAPYEPPTIDGTLLSDTGKPSVMGAAMAGQDQQPSTADLLAILHKHGVQF